METEVPLSLFPRTATGMFFDVPQDSVTASSIEEKTPRVVPQVVEPSRPEEEQLKLNPVASDFGPCEGHFIDKEYDAHQNLPMCPPPTRSVTPMFSLYATVKVSNIRQS